MSEHICRRCGQPGDEPEMGDFSEYVKPAEQHLGTWEHYSMQGCITALRAALAAATAREEKFRQDVVALCMSLTHEGPDVTSRVTTRVIEARSGTLDALAAHTEKMALDAALRAERERVVRWLREYAASFRAKGMTPDAVAVFAEFAADHIAALDPEATR